jgi:DNA-binding MarR family transcriptional regulator
VKPPEYEPQKIPAASFDLERFLPYRLSLLTNTISGGIARSYRDRHGISIHEWRVLAVLGRFPGISASDIVRHTAMDKVSISRAVRSLVDKGLLERRPDRSDRRRMRLLLTADRGQSLLGQIVPLARQYERELLKALDRAEAAAFSRALAKLQRRAESIEAD